MRWTFGMAVLATIAFQGCGGTDASPRGGPSAHDERIATAAGPYVDNWNREVGKWSAAIKAGRAPFLKVEARYLSALDKSSRSIRLLGLQVESPMLKPLWRELSSSYRAEFRAIATTTHAVVHSDFAAARRGLARAREAKRRKLRAVKKLAAAPEPVGG